MDDALKDPLLFRSLQESEDIFRKAHEGHEVQLPCLLKLHRWGRWKTVSAEGFIYDLTQQKECLECGMVRLRYELIENRSAKSLQTPRWMLIATEVFVWCGVATWLYLAYRALADH